MAHSQLGRSVALSLLLGACAGKLGAAEGNSGSPGSAADGGTPQQIPSSGEDTPDTANPDGTGSGSADDPADTNPDGSDPSRPGTAPTGSSTNAEPSTDSSSSSPPAATAPDCSLPSAGAPAAMRRLTSSQVAATVGRILGVELELNVEDERLLTFRSNIASPVDLSAVRSIQTFARSAAEQTELACAEDCVTWLLDVVAPQLFGQPLVTEQRELYAALFEAGNAQDGADAGARWVIEALLQSPNFLYTDEVNDADGYLEPYAVASRLSLTLWGQKPDTELLDLAATDALSTADGVGEAATRLLEDPRSAQGLGTFVDEWLDIARLEAADSRPDVAALGSDTVSALRAEPGRFFADLLRQGANLQQLMTSSETVASEGLADVYGADLLTQDGERWQLDPERRAGLLTLPGVLAALSHAERTSPTLRGRAVLAQLLCSPPSPPPAGLSVTLPEATGNETTRQLMELHFSDPSCASCHRHMDGIGFALERFDWLGRFRETENGEAIDDRGTLIIGVSNSPAGAKEVEVEGATELSKVLLDDPRLANCVAQQWTQYATSVARATGAECLLQELTTSLSEPDGLRKMVLTSFTSDWLRRGPESSQ